MADPLTARPVEPTWRLSGAIWVGLLLLLFLLVEIFLDFKSQVLLLPYYLTSFQRTQLLFLLLAPVQFAAAAYVAMRIGKLRSVAVLLQSIEWNPDANIAVPVIVGFGLAGLVTTFSIRVFGRGANQFDGYAPQSVLLFVLSSVLAQPFIEEFYYRGVLFCAVARRISVVVAIISTALLFAWFHPMHRVAILPVALVLGVTKMKTKSVASCFAQHAAYNLGILLFQFVYWR